jgi:hypothetical protein
MGKEKFRTKPVCILYQGNITIGNIQIEVKKTRLGTIRASNPGIMKKISKKAITFYKNAS